MREREKERESDGGLDQGVDGRGGKNQLYSGYILKTCLMMD